MDINTSNTIKMTNKAVAHIKLHFIQCCLSANGPLWTNITSLLNFRTISCAIMVSISSWISTDVQDVFFCSHCFKSGESSHLSSKSCFMFDSASTCRQIAIRWRPRYLRVENIWSRHSVTFLLSAAHWSFSWALMFVPWMRDWKCSTQAECPSRVWPAPCCVFRCILWLEARKGPSCFSFDNHMGRYATPSSIDCCDDRDSFTVSTGSSM